MTNDPILAPIINMNGSSAKNLLEDIRDAAEKITEATDALRKTVPHGRDFQVGYCEVTQEASVKKPCDATIINRAQDQHFARMQKLDTIYRELVAIYQAIEDQQR